MTVTVDTNGQGIQAAVDALRAENILAETLEVSYNDQLFVIAGFPHPDGVDIMSRFDEVDARVRSALDKACIDGEIRGHGLADGARFGSR